MSNRPSHPATGQERSLKGAALFLAVVFATPALAYDATIEQNWTGDEASTFAPEVDRQVGAVITVGSPAACGFSDLQSAINSASDGDRLQLVDETFSGTYRISSKALTIVGGYPDCNPASSPSGRSTLDGGGAGPVLDILYAASEADPLRQVNIENLVIRNGGGIGFFSGGVIVEGLPGRLEASFRNVEISGNERQGATDNGAGLRVVVTGDSVSGGSFGGALAALDNQSTVFGNSAGGDGGGVHCLSNFDVESPSVTTLRMGTTLVFDNEAENGGGVAIDGCRNVFLYNGGPIVFIFPAGGIVGNTAQVFGGGLFLDNNAEVSFRALEFQGFGNADEAALLAGNTADFGGGANLVNGSELILEDAYVTGNTGTLFNGGIGVGSESELTVRRGSLSDECPDPVIGGGVLSRPPCSVIENNSSQNVAGIGATTGAILDISRTIFRGNEATDAGGISALRATGVSTFPGTDVRAEGLLIHDNTGDATIRIQGLTTMFLTHSTVTDNTGDVVQVDAPTALQPIFDVASSILRAPAGASVLTESGPSSASTSATCVIANRSLADTGFDIAPQYSRIDGPLFRDPANDDYRLGFRSPAIDYCANSGGSMFVGLDGGTRGTAWTGPTPDSNPAGASGDYDLGAYERPWQIQPADLAVEAVMPDTFLEEGESILLDLLVSNNGPQTGFAEIDVIDDFSTAQLTNQQWICVPPAGASCSPASGSGDVNTVISDLAPGQSVVFEVSADQVDPNVDLDFQYTMIVIESGFNIDPSPANNDVLLDFTAGLFADSFESVSP